MNPMKIYLYAVSLTALVFSGRNVVLAFQHFGSSSSPITSRTLSRKWASVSPLKESDPFNKPQNDAPTISQDEAVLSLAKLLQRQTAELEETRRLLEVLKGSEEKTGPESLSMAASLMKSRDYGFNSRSEGPTFSELKGGEAFVQYGPPANVLRLGFKQFFRNLDAMRGEYEGEEDIELTEEQKELQSKLDDLTLDSNAIWEREGKIEAPLIIKIPYLFLCYMLDVVFESKYVPARFFLLETVARMPYFSYISMLHLYESLGFWRRSADVKRVHFAEELNEYRHLLIMESLGGDQKWWVRFMAQHSALAYFLALCILWLLSPTLSYRFSELLETHAVNTYSQFLDENEDVLKELPPPMAATDYYCFGASDPFYSEFQTTAISSGGEIRRPGKNMMSLYDVFTAIRDDEGDHVSTMNQCLDPSAAVRSASLEQRLLFGSALFVAGSSLFAGDASMIEGILGQSLGDGSVVEAIAGTIAGLAGLDAVLGGAEVADIARDAMDSPEGAELLTGEVTDWKELLRIVSRVLRL